MTDLSIIIVTYNPGPILFDCLSSLPDGAGTLDYEVLVVDNNSTDGVPHAAAEQHPKMRFIFNRDNRGFAGANNQGLELVQGRYLLLLNPDVIVEPVSLQALVEFLEATPSAGIAGPRTLDGSGQVTLTAHTDYKPPVILWQYLGLDRLLPNRVYGRYRRACETAAEPFPVAWVQGCCLLLRRAVYEQIGGLDEEFFLFAEEPDFCDRAQRAGWSTWFIPAARVHHLESTSVKRYHEARIRSYHLSPLHYFRKRGQVGAMGVLKIGFTLELGLKAIVRLSQRDGERVRVYGRVVRAVWVFESV